MARDGSSGAVIHLNIYPDERFRINVTVGVRAAICNAAGAGPEGRTAAQELAKELW